MVRRASKMKPGAMKLAELLAGALNVIELNVIMPPLEMTHTSANRRETKTKGGGRAGEGKEGEVRARGGKAIVGEGKDRARISREDGRCYYCCC